ncbi:hypothetical protein LTR66_017145, partial [Elasticomyces elasticus]
PERHGERSDQPLRGGGRLRRCQQRHGHERRRSRSVPRAAGRRGGSCGHRRCVCGYFWERGRAESDHYGSVL